MALAALRRFHPWLPFWLAAALSLFTQTFALAIGPLGALHLPGAPFLLAALMLVGSLMVAWRVTSDRLAERIS